MKIGKHTLEPWSIRTDGDESDGHSRISIVGWNEWIVAEIYPGGWTNWTNRRDEQDTPYDSDEHEANTYLIAAAPETAAERDMLKAINAELLAALEALIDACNLALFQADQYRDEKCGGNRTPEAQLRYDDMKNAVMHAREKIAAAKGYK